jgi:hypothetical protein
MEFPIRARSPHGPYPRTEFTRRCVVCRSDFIALAPGKTGERGLWDEWKWYCSRECYDHAQRTTPLATAFPALQDAHDGLTGLTIRKDGTDA